MGSLRVGHNWATSLSLFTFTHWRRKWQPTPVFLPGESQGRGAWWAAIYGVAQSWTRLTQLSSSSSNASSAQFSRPVVSNSLQLHGPQHARPPCPSPTPEVCSNSDVHCISDAIQPLSSPSPPAFNLAQHQGPFQWVSCSNQVAKVLEFQLRHQSFQWTFRTDFI